MPYHASWKLWNVRRAPAPDGGSGCACAQEAQPFSEPGPRSHANSHGPRVSTVLLATEQVFPLGAHM